MQRGRAARPSPVRKSLPLEHKQKYYSELNAVRETGDFERWLEFFATAIRVSAEQATTTGQRVFTVFQETGSA